MKKKALRTSEKRVKKIVAAQIASVRADAYKDALRHVMGKVPARDERDVVYLNEPPEEQFVRVPVGPRDRLEHVVFEYVLMGMTLQNGARIRWFALQPRGGNAPS